MRSLGDQPELEEERRLAYVGVTRAQRAALRLPRRGPLRLGRAVAQPGVAVPRRAAGRPRRLAPHRGRADVVEPARCCRRCRSAAPARRPRRFGTAAAARRRRRRSAAGSRRGARSLDPGDRVHARLVRDGHRGRPRGRRRQGGRLDRLRRRRASSGCCCATPRWRSSSGSRLRPGPPVWSPLGADRASEHLHGLRDAAPRSRARRVRAPSTAVYAQPPRQGP